jgi:protease IV
MPAAPKRKWVKFVILGLVAMLMASVALVLFMAAMVAILAHNPQTHVTEEILHKGSSGSSAKIVIFPVTGTVDDDMVERMRTFCDHVKDDADVKAVILEINSPGGGITASDEIHHLFTDLRTKYNKKLVVSMRSLAASGGYYVAVPAEKIYAERTTLTGSIGVIWPAFEVTEMMEKIGVKPEIIKSDEASNYKDAGSPLKKFTKEDRDYIRALTNAAHKQFKSVVEEGRKGRLTVPIDDIAVGKIWTAAEAKEKGLIDDIKYPDEIVAQVASEIGVADPKVIRLKRLGGFFDVLGASAQPTKIEVKLDPHTMESIQDAAAGKLEYRYTGPTP